MKEGYVVAHSSTMHSIDDYILRSQPYPANQPLNHTYYRFQPHSGALPLLQHSHELMTATNSNPPVSESLALTEMSLVNRQFEANGYYSARNSAYPPDPSSIVHHSQQSSSDIMTNAFTYNVNSSSSATGLYPITTDLVTISSGNPNQRTYTEIGATMGDLPHHVTTLGPMVGCIDSLSSSTSEKTVDVEDEWHLPKHSMINDRTSPLTQQQSQPYLAYVRSNEVCNASTIFQLALI